MATYATDVDKTEAGQGIKFSCTVGTGGTTAGSCVKWDGTNANTVIKCTADTDNVIGIARDTVSAAGTVTVLSDGCLVATGVTLTVGGAVGCHTDSTVDDWSANTYVGSAVTAGGDVRVKIQW